MFLALVFGALAATFVYTGVRLTAPFGANRKAKIAAWSFLVFLVLCILWFPASWVLPLDLGPLGLGWLQSWLIFVSMGLYMVLGLTVVLRDLGWALVWTVGRLRARYADFLGDQRAEVVSPGRREALRSLVNVGTIFAAAALGGGGFFGARRRAAVTEVEVPIHDLPDTLAGFRIVQISDLHVGNTVTREYVEAIVECVNDLAADLVAVTGDLTDGEVERLRRHVEPLGRIRARHGAFFVTGNHDYYFGQGREWVAETRRLGLTTLVNEHRLIEHDGGRLIVAGVPDFKAADLVEEHRSDPGAALQSAPASDVKVLLAHQPRSAAAAAAAGFDLQLSGHTHGGQVFPFHFVARLTQPFIAGLHRFRDMWVYVNRGTGYWGPPIRLLAPSEITVLTLVRG